MFILLSGFEKFECETRLLVRFVANRVLQDCGIIEHQDFCSVGRNIVGVGDAFTSFLIPVTETNGRFAIGQARMKASGGTEVHFGRVMMDSVTTLAITRSVVYEAIVDPVAPFEVAYVQCGCITTNGRVIQLGIIDTAHFLFFGNK